MKRLASYVCGAFHPGTGGHRPIVNPATEAVLAESSTDGIDFVAALAFARDRGGPALRGLTFKQRAGLLRAMAQTIHETREELIELAIQNGGNTRSDAKFDIDGASFTLASYADLGEKLGDVELFCDGDLIQVGRTARYAGQHVFVPRTGVAVHVNAFNFPAWGMAEKAAMAILAGMPVISKPAIATCLVAHRMVEAFVAKKCLPDGALSFIAGSTGNLLEALGGQDVLSFTGSSDTARTLRGLESVLARSVHVNVEADSLNAAFLGADVSLSSETFALFKADVVRDMTQKTGQKCTAIRRVLVPRDACADVVAALSESLSAIVVGNPANEDVRMGPVATASQKTEVKNGIAALAAVTDAGFGGSGDIAPKGIADGKGFFVGPVLRVAKTVDVGVVHEREVFGPVATVLPYDDRAHAFAAIARGGGGLVSSIYSDDRDVVKDAVLAMAPYHGRLYLGSEKMASQSSGPGTVIPTLLHGGPGRAGGGEELGGLRGMALYLQRTALQGDRTVITALTGGE
jgi:oxepin-CoA hydrolase/3-oxo-5,6-dehydrosuberyl-CoA semialdehyde dehydrogenase